MGNEIGYGRFAVHPVVLRRALGLPDNCEIVAAEIDRAEFNGRATIWLTVSHPDLPRPSQGDLPVEINPSTTDLGGCKLDAWGIPGKS